jgi:hypothetical protein
MALGTSIYYRNKERTFWSLHSPRFKLSYMTDDHNGHHILPDLN